MQNLCGCSWMHSFCPKMTPHSYLWRNEFSLLFEFLRPKYCHSKGLLFHKYSCSYVGFSSFSATDYTRWDNYRVCSLSNSSPGIQPHAEYSKPLLRFLCVGQRVKQDGIRGRGQRRAVYFHHYVWLFMHKVMIRDTNQMNSLSVCLKLIKLGKCNPLTKIHVFQLWGKCRPPNREINWLRVPQTGHQHCVLFGLTSHKSQPI